MNDSSIQISVCICAHNPREDYLARVLDGVARQTLAPDRWELILVDNKSRDPLEGRVDLAAIRNARIVSENTLGLTHARLRAIREAAGNVLVFVDDDNVLDVDYLEGALAILDDNPFIGVIGGRCRGAFESPPPRWTRRFLPYLAVVDHGPNPVWGRCAGGHEPWFPCGAGLVIRRPLAEAYARQLEADPERMGLDRRGGSLGSAGDIDMILTVMDEGSAAGYFPQLSLTHLIPAGRLRFGYLKRMIRQSNDTTYGLYLRRGIVRRPRPRPLAYLGNVGLCVVQGDWPPMTWLLEFQITGGRHAAWLRVTRPRRANDKGEMTKDK